MQPKPIATSIKAVPVTVERKPFIQPNDDLRLTHPGTARANVAATYDHPDGTTTGGWAEHHKHQTVLQQHCAFFDTDGDGIIWPSDTFRGFSRLGFSIFLALLSTIIIHANFAYPTSPSIIPDPFFRLYIQNIHRAKHGSDTGTYDNEGRFVPQKFEDMFAKYAGEKEYITFRDVIRLLKGQRGIMDPIGWGGAFFEWAATYILLWPEDGRMKKEDIRRIYDGSLFYAIAAQRAKK
ncbi:Caleosin-domain-containing protein [Thozetella sp. PMI_491]|nr:Caleosin-domain-containing protein [Thozetella sp. PMI_491]